MLCSIFSFFSLTWEESNLVHSFKKEVEMIFVEGQLITLLLSRLTFFFSSSGAKYANFSSPSNRHATRRLSIDQSEWLTRFAVTHLEFLTILPSPKPTQICVISKFHRLASERVDIYTPTALGSSDQTSEFLMRKLLVSGNKYLTAGGLQKKVNHFNPFTAIFLLSLSVALFSFIFLAYRADNDYQCS